MANKARRPIKPDIFRGRTPDILFQAHLLSLVSGTVLEKKKKSGKKQHEATLTFEKKQNFVVGSKKLSYFMPWR